MVESEHVGSGPTHHVCQTSETLVSRDVAAGSEQVGSDSLHPVRATAAHYNSFNSFELVSHDSLKALQIPSHTAWREDFRVQCIPNASSLYACVGALDCADTYVVASQVATYIATHLHAHVPEMSQLFQLLRQM